MHPCLYVDEIIRRIAHELVTSGGEGTSVALACCCKSLEDPMLDVLWETKDSLFLLFKSLPRDVWNGRKHSVSPPAMCALSLLDYSIWKPFRRHPTTMEWARFQKYAQRMRRLYLRCDGESELFPALQLRAVDKLLLPNLKWIYICFPSLDFIPLIPLFLTPRTTAVTVAFDTTNPLPKATVASMITTFPTLCPNLQDLALDSLPRDPMITASVYEMLLASNRNILRRLKLDSPLTVEAYEVVFGLPNLRELWVVVAGDISLPTMELPNLTELTVKYYHDRHCLQLFRGATLGEVTSVTFYSESESIGNFLEEFKHLALTISISATLSSFVFSTSRSWKPNYRSLLPFTHLNKIVINFSCQGGCSSTVDDDIITDIARAMPRLETLQFGHPCETPAGVTVKGLAALAHHCPHLSTLCIHFQLATLDPQLIPGITAGDRPATPRGDCALTYLIVGRIPLPEESVLMVTLTLLLIFPSVFRFAYSDERWGRVKDAITRSKQFVHHSSKKLSLSPPWSK